MEIYPTHLYVNLKLNRKAVPPVPAMYVSRTTTASLALRLSVGDTVSAVLTKDNLVTIETCQLTQEEFRSWREGRGLSWCDCFSHYGISPEKMLEFEGLESA